MTKVEKIKQKRMFNGDRNSGAMSFGRIRQKFPYFSVMEQNMQLEELEKAFILIASQLP